MTDAVKLAKLKVMILPSTSTDEVLTAILENAGQIIIRRLNNDNITVVPTRYEYVQLLIAQALYNKRGAEGETAHSENGISRTYAAADVPPELMKMVMPFARSVDDTDGW